MSSQNNRTLESAINRLVDNLNSQEGPSGSRDLLTNCRPEQMTNQPEAPVVTIVEDDRRLFEADNHWDENPDLDDEPSPSGLQLQDEFKQLHLLTQYLEPSSSKAETSSKFINMTPATRKEYELAKVKQNYLEKTDRIDKMSGT